ncbi:unnamed protein product [Linum tenue]|uniref:Uncharacterized protein n=1 Tax=Linum tenue TaxID=586396 RepID=A0AAV0PTT8_9ROSI|nr:unnamed protein product [Linum tenue]
MVTVSQYKKNSKRKEINIHIYGGRCLKMMHATKHLFHRPFSTSSPLDGGCSPPLPTSPQ